MNTKLINTSIEPPRKHPRSAFILFALACFALLPSMQAVVPAPDGGYPGGNTAEGQNALFRLTTGTYNTAVGLSSLYNITESSFNTAIGAAALLADTTGARNTATGAGALLSNTTGSANTGMGAFALFSNTAGGFNTAVGDRALITHIAGDNNTAIGASALFSDATGVHNTAIGAAALFGNITGDSNAAVGDTALASNTAGSGNTAVGREALFSNDSGINNTAIGRSALHSNSAGILNTAAGWGALAANTTGSYNTAIGDSALANNTTGRDNIAVGDFAGANHITGDFNIYIGNDGEAEEAGQIRIGSTCCQSRAFMAGIWGVIGPGTPVYVYSNGLLSEGPPHSARFEYDIQSMDAASDTLFRLRPVTFRYAPELDSDGIRQFGLIAEDVQTVNPDLVARDKEGKPLRVRYDQVYAMLLNEFLKEHATAQEMKKEIAALKEGLQKVSAQLEASKPAAQVVNNP
jgi:hypothetical protein